MTSEARRLSYMPALDGLRAFAVLAVILYHGGVTWAKGGYLGVDAFFVLSGFLITGLLLTEWRERGGIALSAFWARRARRLLPALFLVLAAVAAYGAYLAPVGTLRDLRGDGLSTLAYGANWHFILQGQSYFAQFAAPSPLRHVWSLAIEEQFYVVWPLLLVGLLRLTRGSRRAVLGVTVTGAAGSALLMSYWYASADPSRVYYGTDTRAQSLLIGAALAVVLADRTGPSRRVARAALQAAGIMAAGALGWAWLAIDDHTSWLYHGGYALLAALVAIVIASARGRSRGPVGAFLSLGPLRWVGQISYGLYLWHWPVDVVCTPARLGMTGTRLLGVRLALTFAIATVSYYLVERPIRRGALRGLRARVALSAAGGGVLAVLLAVTAGGPVSSVVAAAHSPSAEASRATPVGAPAAVSLQAMHGLLVSDSVGLTLGPGFDRVADPREFVMVNASVLGCGVLRGEAFIEGAWHRNAPKCDDWPQRWRDELGQFRPQLVVSLWGAWDMYDWRVGGRVLRFGTPEADEFVLGELDDAVGVLTSQGARLIALTSPYYEPLNAVNRPGEWRSRYDEPRVDHWNALLGQLAARHPGNMVLLDLHAFLSPGGKFTNSIGGVDDVRGDGVHFTPAGADLVARWLTPRMLRIARSTGVTPPATTNASIGRQSAAG